LLFTDVDEQQLEPLETDVDIVGTSNLEGSRIIKSLSPDAGNRLLGSETDASPWRAAARRNLEIMYRTAHAVSHTLALSQLASRIIDVIFGWVEADRGCIMLVDHETSELMPAASRTRPGIDAGERIAISRAILEYVTQRKEGVLTSNAREDARWTSESV